MENQQTKDFGVLYGQKTTEDALLIYSSYEDSKASPQTGDFIVLAPRDEDGKKFLARVEAEIYDEDPIFRSQDKTLVAVHYARIAERDLSERDKQKMFSYTYKVKLLGSFTSDGKDFTTAVRKLPIVSYHARHLTQREFDNIINGSNQNGKKIGSFCIGEDVKNKYEVLFDVNKLKSKRTMVFAQSGFGKTNLVKGLIGNTVMDTTVGKLIFDLEGEYAFKSQKNYGLVDLKNQNFRENIIVYTDKKLPSFYENIFQKSGNVKIDLGIDFSIGDLIQTAIGLTSAGRNFLEYIESLPDKKSVNDFIGKIANNEDPKDIRRFAYTKFASYFEASKKKEDKEIEKDISQANRAMLGGVIRQIKSYSSIHEKDSNFIKGVLNALQEGKTVIVDMSLKDNEEASIISTMLVKRLFENNKKAHTPDTANDYSVIPCIIFVEEAQNVLSDEFVRSNANPFVKIAKQGRKFDIGLVSITQRPSAISEEIRSQAENYFVMHMSNSKDIKALIESNIGYSGSISKFIQHEAIAGNLYMVSAKQTFVIPLRVDWFEKRVHQSILEELKFSKEEMPGLYQC